MASNTPIRYVRGRASTMSAHERAQLHSTHDNYTSATSLTRPQPVADPTQRTQDSHQRIEHDAQQRLTSPADIPRCHNDLCRRPEIAMDEEIRSGPRGMQLCRRCHRRYKLEKKAAKEEGRRVTDDWKKPKRKPSRLQDGVDSAASPTVERQVNSDDSQCRRDQSEAFVHFSNNSPLTPTGEVATSFKMPASTLSAGSDSSSWVDSEKQSLPAGRYKSHGPMRSPTEGSLADEERYPSVYDETEYYKYGHIEEEHDSTGGCCDCGCCFDWSRRRRWIVFGGSAFVVLVIIICAAVGVSLSHHSYSYIPSTAQVNNTLAFSSGGATTQNVNETNDGSGAGRNVYTYYSGNASQFPSHTSWISFDEMWSANLATMQSSCGHLQSGPDDSNTELQYLYDAIQNRANASLVDHRIILATVLQESKGCVRVGATTSSGGVNNPGLMQSHNGHTFDSRFPRLSILNMIQDGTQGTASGDGLVQLLNVYGNPYEAMRGYNSGYIPKDGDLSEAAGATACYVSDMANRLTGWVDAASTCPGV